MQLAGQNPEPDQKVPPSIYAALVYSLFQNPAPMFAGALCAAVAAIMTAVKTGNAWLWPCVALLIVTGAARALDMRSPLTTSPATGAVVALVREHVEGPGPDRFLAPEIAAVVGLVQSGAVVTAAEGVVGPLR